MEWSLGAQPTSVGPTRLFVVPNPSPANAHFSLGDQISWYDRLATYLKEGRPERPGEEKPYTMDAEKTFASVADELRKDRRVGTARMFGAAGLKVSDKYFAMLYKGRLVVKLPGERVSALVESGDGEYFDPGHGRLMKEWVSLDPRLARRWRGLAEAARDFVAESTAGGRPAGSKRASKARRRPSKAR